MWVDIHSIGGLANTVAEEDSSDKAWSEMQVADVEAIEESAFGCWSMSCFKCCYQEKFADISFKLLKRFVVSDDGYCGYGRVGEGKSLTMRVQLQCEEDDEKWAVDAPVNSILRAGGKISREGKQKIQGSALHLCISIEAYYFTFRKTLRNRRL